MTVERLDLPGVRLLRTPVHRDARGLLYEAWTEDRRAANDLPATVQRNLTRSGRHVLRGLHFQLRRPQCKLLTVITGTILDVVADVRPGSPTFGQHVAVELAGASGVQLWVPAGYAHGFVVLSDEADVLYELTAPYVPDDQHGVRWDDPELAIDWRVAAPVISAADAALPTLAEAGVRRLPPWVGC